MAKLLVQESAGVREFELVDGEVRIGRELDNTLRLADPSISRYHALLRRTPEGYEIQDLKSSNGVLVNGARVGAAVLKDRDRITLGQVQVTFVDPMAVYGAGAPEAVEEAPSPLGTIRMNASEMAKIQSLGAPRPVPNAVPPVAVPPPPLATRPIQAQAPPEGSTSTQGDGSAANPTSFQEPGEETSYVSTEAARALSLLERWLPRVVDDAQPVMGPTQVPERGDFLTRLAAFLIDAVPFFAFNLLLLFCASFLGAMGGAVGAGLGCVIYLLSVVVSLAALVFWPWCWIKYGATPGKKIMKLRVVPEADPRGRVDLGQAVLRMVGSLLNFGVGYLLIFGEQRKGVQDMLSNTVVIKVDR